MVMKPLDKRKIATAERSCTLSPVVQHCDGVTPLELFSVMVVIDVACLSFADLELSDKKHFNFSASCRSSHASRGARQECPRCVLSLEQCDMPRQYCSIRVPGKCMRVYEYV